MPYVPLKFPPGVVRPGTLYDAKGRWYDTDLVRWHADAMQPVGGWETWEPGPVTGYPTAGAIRGLHAWRDNNHNACLALGDASALIFLSVGSGADITPASFTTGLENATGDEWSVGGLTEAQNWSFDNYGEDLVACAYSDGQILYWDTSVGAGTPAAALSSAPTGCMGVVVTPERFIVALAAGGDRRAVQWCDQEDSTDWTPTVTNQAGDFLIQTGGEILAARRGKNETLIWTDMDLHAMRYIGGQLIYSFQQVGEKCGAISRRSMAMVAGKAIWMGRRAFYVYDGYVRPVPCEVGDYVFNDINLGQVSKVAADVRNEFGEVWWYYPSSGSTENDRYVAWDYIDDHWMIGTLSRTAGVDQGAFPLALAGNADGYVWKHETGTSYLDAFGGTQMTPHAISGPLEIAQGDRVMHVQSIIPDEATLGDVDLYIHSALFPTGTETVNGPYSPANPTDVRITARQVRLKVQQDQPGWRFGTPRLDVEPGGLR